MIHDTKPPVDTGVTAGHNEIAESSDITRTALPVRPGPAGNGAARCRRIAGDVIVGYRGARKQPRPTRPMFWESHRRWRDELDERPAPPECLYGVLTTDYTPRSLPPITVMRRRQREKAAVRIPFGPPGGAR